MPYEWFLIFVLHSTPAGDEVVGNGYYVLEECPTKAHCSKRAGEYREAWPFISQFGQFLIMSQERVI